MNKIKYFMLAMMAFIASATFTACSSDDDNGNKGGSGGGKVPESNYQKYQKVVNETVNSQKKSNKVILLVAFGSTWEQAYDTFDKVVDEYKAAFSGWSICLSLLPSVSTTPVLVRMLIRRISTILSTGSPPSDWQAISRSWYSRCR